MYFAAVLRPQLPRHGLDFDIFAVRQRSRPPFVISLLGLAEPGEPDQTIAPYLAVSRRLGSRTQPIFLSYTAKACLPVVATRMLHSIHRHPLTRIDLVPSHSHTSGSHPLAISAPQQGYCQYIEALSTPQSSEQA